jgi:hypothetical protein
MTTETDLTKKQLALILSALDDAPRSPANKGEALRAIGRSAARIGLTAEDVLAAAPGLLDERLTSAEFRAELQDLLAGSDSAADAEPQPETGAPPAEEAATAPQDGEETPPATEVPEVVEQAPGAAEAAPEAPAAAKPTPRAGTKQAQMIEMLKRPEGATVEQIAAATGVEWRRSALPSYGDRFLRPPLRTGRASFPASGSPCSAHG